MITLAIIIWVAIAIALLWKDDYIAIGWVTIGAVVLSYFADIHGNLQNQPGIAGDPIMLVWLGIMFISILYGSIKSFIYTKFEYALTSIPVSLGYIAICVIVSAVLRAFCII
jgi:hypothetical protein